MFGVCPSAQRGRSAGGIILKMELLNLVQWPAMGLTLLASWFVASSIPARRNLGFWLFLGSNGLWIVWGWFDGAYALIALQVGLAVMNVRGAGKTETETKPN
jgi:hypothetical protein